MNHLAPSSGSKVLRLFGVGDTGLSVLEMLIAGGVSPGACVAANAATPALAGSGATQKIRLETKNLRGLGSGGDPERGRLAAEEQSEALKSLCEGADVVFILAGLGGGSGTGISPVIARLAKAAGALVIGFVTLPFDCEGTRRRGLAEEGLEELRAAADAVVCLPNQKVFKLIDANTTVLDTFRIVDQLLADVAQGLWRLLSLKGLIEIPLDDVCRLLQARHCDSGFAVAEAAGLDRSARVLEKLLAHPVIDEGAALAEAEVVLVSLAGGRDLTMAEVNQLIEQIQARCESAQVLMGASVDDRFGDRLAVTLMTFKKAVSEPAPHGRAEELDTQLLDRKATTRPGSRFLPPPPALPADQVQKLLSRQTRGSGAASRRSAVRLRQTQLPLEIVSKGRFDKSEPTIHKGEDLDVPTYIRRGVPLN